MTTFRNPLIAKLHIAKKDMGLSDGDYRALLAALTGKDSAKDLTDRQLTMVIERLKLMGWKPKKAETARAKNPQARMIFGLWAELGQSGALNDTSRGALFSFCERQTGVSSPDWLTPVQSNKLIEALKAWIARSRQAVA